MAIEDAENGEHADIQQGMAMKNISRVTGPLGVQQSIYKLGILSHLDRILTRTKPQAEVILTEEEYSIDQ
jgi:hypothetical protein